MTAVFRIVEELDDLFGNSSLGGAVAVGRSDENERLGYLKVVVGGPERDPQCGPLEPVHESAGVLRHGGKVDDVSHGPPHSARDTARARASPEPFGRNGDLLQMRHTGSATGTGTAARG